MRYTTKYKQRLSASGQYIHELINSGITLNDKETKIVEDYLEYASKPVQARASEVSLTKHLNHFKCVAAVYALNK